LVRGDIFVLFRLPAVFAAVGGGMEGRGRGERKTEKGERNDKIDKMDEKDKKTLNF
jgi:hypothetical protein